MPETPWTPVLSSSFHGSEGEVSRYSSYNVFTVYILLSKIVIIIDLVMLGFNIVQYTTFKTTITNFKQFKFKKNRLCLHFI